MTPLDRWLDRLDPDSDWRPIDAIPPTLLVVAVSLAHASGSLRVRDLRGTVAALAPAHPSLDALVVHGLLVIHGAAGAVTGSAIAAVVVGLVFATGLVRSRLGGMASSLIACVATTGALAGIGAAPWYGAACGLALLLPAMAFLPRRPEHAPSHALATGASAFLAGLAAPGIALPAWVLAGVGLAVRRERDLPMLIGGAAGLTLGGWVYAHAPPALPMTAQPLLWAGLALVGHLVLGRLRQDPSADSLPTALGLGAALAMAWWASDTPAGGVGWWLAATSAALPGLAVGTTRRGPAVAWGAAMLWIALPTFAVGVDRTVSAWEGPGPHDVPLEEIAEGAGGLWLPANPLITEPSLSLVQDGTLDAEAWVSHFPGPSPHDLHAMLAAVPGALEAANLPGIAPARSTLVPDPLQLIAPGRGDPVALLVPRVPVPWPATSPNTAPIARTPLWDVHPLRDPDPAEATP